MADALENWLTRGRVRMRQLLLLRALGAERNLRRAAERLGLAQPAATRLVRELEETLGVTLFERSSRGMLPTVFGDALIRRAETVLADLDAARLEVGALMAGSTGQVRVGTLNSIAPQLLSRAMARVAAQRPGLQIGIHEANHEQVSGMLARGALDLALLRARPGADAPGLRYELLYREPFHVVAGPAHRLARARRVTLSDLVDQPWILPPPRVPLRGQLELLFLEATGRVPRAVIETASILNQQSLLESAPLVAPFAEDAARHYQRQGLVRILPVALAGLTGPVALVTREAVAHAPAVLALLESLRESARSRVAPTPA